MLDKLNVFIRRKPIAFSILIFALTLDLALFFIGLNNYSEFAEKPVYEYRNQVVSIKGGSIFECVPITSKDMRYFGQQFSDGDEEMLMRVEFLNQIDRDEIFLLVLLVSIYSLLTSVMPCILDLVLTTIETMKRNQVKDTQKISFMRNLLLLNWVQMESLVLITSIANSISYEQCLEPSDSALLFKDNLIVVVGLYLFAAIVQLYCTLYFMITQRNSFSCQFLTFLLLNFVTFHTIIIYHTSIGSKKAYNVVFTFKQWVTVFVIFKLQSEFEYTQVRHYQLRINAKKLQSVE